MGLTPQPTFAYLTQDERDALEDAFVSASVSYDVTMRERLLDGVNRQYVIHFLPITGFDPSTQLNSDLRRMNQVERLTDGTVPLSTWLRNAVRRFGPLPAERAMFETALAKVSRKGDMNRPVIQKSDVTVVDFEEIIADEIDDMQSATFLSIGATRLQSIAKVIVPRYEDTELMKLPDGNARCGSGTGWMIGSDLLMTNYHVIRNRLPGEGPPSDEDLRLQAEGTTAQFFFDSDGQEGSRIKVKELIGAGKSPSEDFCLLKLSAAPKVPVLPLRDEQIELPKPVQTPKGAIIKALAVNIIQHPGGGPKRVAVRNNLVYSAQYPTLHYFTDTLSGSSGSPVFDDDWRVVALHRAAVAERAEFHGRTFGYVNEGIQIHAILKAIMASNDLKTAGALRQIRDEQPKNAE